MGWQRNKYLYIFLKLIFKIFTIHVDAENTYTFGFGINAEINTFEIGVDDEGVSRKSTDTREWTRKTKTKQNYKKKFARTHTHIHTRARSFTTHWVHWKYFTEFLSQGERKQQQKRRKKRKKIYLRWLTPVV